MNASCSPTVNAGIKNLIGKSGDGFTKQAIEDQTFDNARIMRGRPA